ncbi:cytochrome P450 [Novosphingobium album (ex Hu et al. 2023)]|uniref:Cytochrome P450 n=1 Tax=Novosphingobium album (ex Hu et al. 2023) TaxID=2930093 RepID=A0ABT0B5R4_9SPHN|nr:cytochrome P450 [Novosphingobium album (ex Hu et al. 2023)]MCJ2180249.1 cytochrome P450 [Novosphingobium album (ex Hu et al. 2023)]
MTDFASVDYFNSYDLIPNPHPYFEYLRNQNPVTLLPVHNILAVTGYKEGFEVYRDHKTFSSIVTAKGPFPPLPFVPDEEDISAQLEEHRPTMPYGSMLVAMDQPEHTRTRSLLMGLLTQQRFRENEGFMDGLADRLIDKFIDRGGIEVIGDYSHPFATLAIADLMGVPEEAHEKILPLFGTLPGRLGGDEDMSSNPLAQIGMLFYEYIEDRRRNPRNDVMSILANATYPEGDLPDIQTTTGLAALLFGAGQDTTVRLIAAMLKTLGENPELQEAIRNDRSLIPNFVEEVLRLDGPTKAVFRLARRHARVGDKEIAPGQIVMLVQAAMNRDPRKFEDPNTFKIDRKNARENVSFGLGIHACIGSPLARVEAKLALNKLLDRVKDIRIDETVHGAAGGRRYDYEPNYTQRALRNIHVTFSKA